MVDFNSYLLFIGASIILCIVPGPDMIYLLSRTIAQGKKAGFAAALGINLGGYFHLTAAILGISAIIATSAIAFTILKYCGAAYLIYIGFKAILSNSSSAIDSSDNEAQLSIKSIFWQGFISDVLNPKVAIFFISLLPQFIQADNNNTLTQLIILGITVNIIALLINFVLVWFSHSVSSNLRQSNRVSKVLNNVMGTIFISLGLKLATEQR
ncbi:MAG: RhtB (resistance to homoserine/threonine) family protein [Alteromonadaceae bacterium]|jgi:RhtB (resistance to homoserine/threonine) family protein